MHERFRTMIHRSFADAREALAHGETCCEAIVSSFLERIDAENGRLNALTHVDAEGALGHARYLDSQLERGHTRPLIGLVLAVKDTISIRRQPLTCGSKMLEGFTSLYDATAIARLREAGAIFIGKANCDEFAMGSSGETSHFGPVRHPASDDHVPGGSSSGSAAAVAAGLCHAALGSDTGGSLRQPAAFCGIVGLKPTYGRVSRFGLVAHASSLDTLGPMGRTVEDVAALLGVLAGQDPSDATSAPVEVPDFGAALTGSVRGLRIGLPQEYFPEDLDAGIRQRLDEQVARLKEGGAGIKEVSLPHTEYGLAAYYLIAATEASSNLARYDGLRYGHHADLKEKKAAPAGARGAAPGSTTETETTLDRLYAQSRTEGFGAEVKRRILLGTHVLSAGHHESQYRKAQKARALIKGDFDRAFEEVDVLLTPATPTPAFERGSRSDDPLAMYLGDVFTVNASLAGLPGLSVPIGAHPEAPHLPVGMQLLGRHFDEALLLQVGDAVMRAQT